MLFRLCKEPLLYFALLGGLIYAFYTPGVGDDDLTANTIELPSSFVAEQRARFEQQYRRAPTESELSGLLEQAINDEILFREAWRLQLYVGDEVVRKRMIQKMRFILDDVEQPMVPNESLIEERLAELMQDATHAGQTTSFNLYHITFASFADAEAYQQQVSNDPTRVPPAPAGVVAFPLGNAFAKISKAETERLFGRDFANELALESTGGWQGPIKSRYGFHVVKLADVEQQAPATDVAVRSEIRQEIIRQLGYKQLKAAIETIKNRYVVAYTE